MFSQIIVQILDKRRPLCDFETTFGSSSTINNHIVRPPISLKDKINKYEACLFISMFALFTAINYKYATLRKFCKFKRAVCKRYHTKKLKIT